MRDVIYEGFKGIFHFISTLKVSRVDMEVWQFVCFLLSKTGQRK